MRWFCFQPAVACAGLLAAGVAGANPTYIVLHSFAGAPSDGGYPRAHLTVLSGTLYGGTCIGGANNAGTIFSITPGGTEMVLHDADGALDGSCFSGLTAHAGNLWGTAQSGGVFSSGTLFNISPAYPYLFIKKHDFGATAADGKVPHDGVIFRGGIAIGTTASGGSNSAGTIFTFSGQTETAVHSFDPTAGEGADPAARLTYYGGSFYGTTVAGGTYQEGSVFQMNAAGNITWQHSFSPYDGNTPFTRLVVAAGALYGATFYGGIGAGNLFKIDVSGSTPVYSAVYNFDYVTTGQNPVGDLAVLGGKIYGVTMLGGPANSPCGTIYEFDPNAGPPAVTIHAIDQQTEGCEPYGGLTRYQGWLYGTTIFGGSAGAGTIFKFHP
jgi:uncharacterized repeat protein (TIGR03803 family)